MLRLLVPLLAASLLVPAAGVAAQPPSVATADLLQDDVGDVALTLAGTAGPDATSAYPAADLVSLRLDESVDGFTWVLGVNDIRPPTEDSGADGVEYELRFEHNARFFLMRIHVTLPLFDGRPFMFLDARDAADGDWATIWGTDEVTADLAEDTLTVHLPRPVVADAEGAAPFPGRTLAGISVRARSAFGQGTVNIGGPATFQLPYSVVDDMPDAGTAPAAYPVVVGVHQDGHARLASPTPFRASNGEATTFVYEVQASNLGPENETFELAVRDVPARMSVVLPVPLLPIPSNETVTVPVLATIPFAHQHGAIDRFLLELTSLDDPDSVGRLEMGVNYLAVPQPSGHHDTLYLHNPVQQQGTQGFERGLVPFTMGTMSTLPDEDQAPRFHATGLSFGDGFTRFDWEYELAPALQMGLDLDLERRGTLSIAVSTTAPILQATLEGELYVWGGDALGTLAPVAPVDLPANSQHAFELEFVPVDEGDEVPWQPGSNLAFYVSLSGVTTSTITGSGNPAIEPGASLRLPLNEWHDDVDEALAAVDGPRLESLGPQERFVNPGEAAVFSVALENPTNESIPFRLALTGQNAAWASLPDASVYVPADSMANVTVIVRAPADALDGDRADVILQAFPREEPSLRGLIRLLVEVDTDTDHVDDAPLAKELGRSQDAPAPSLAAAALALAGLAVLRRRK